MTRVPFSVDSRLLRELGERLVGRPHIALAELIKNSYDADATYVLIEFTGDAITITDNGHGMTMSDFTDHWMRIGSTHKEAQGRSPHFGRPLTGSKGVGRLSVQLLADHLELRSRVESNPNEELVARVDWTAAVQAGLLTTATAEVDFEQLESAKQERMHGVSLRLTGLNQEWNEQTFAQLAKEIWPLQPPFRNADGDGFRVQLKSADDAIVETFNSQMTAVLELWSARIRGRLLSLEEDAPTAPVHLINNPDKTLPKDRAPSRLVAINLEFAGQSPRTYVYKIEDCHINQVKFEIRVFDLRNRQPHGVSVGVARSYLNNFGGVHMYDAGFHLPYYGPDSDWLGIEFDHAHRRGTSDFLPPALRVPGGAEHVPTNSRLYGTVEVNTSREMLWASEQARITTDALQSEAANPQDDGGDEEHERPFPASEGLQIQVTRDRLVDTLAYRNLATIVRSAIDIYAMQRAKQVFQATRMELETSQPAPQQAEGLAAALQAYRPQIPPDVYTELKERLDETTNSITKEARARQASTGLLASLATAGITALAYEHEVGKQFLALDKIVGDLRSPGEIDRDAVADALEDWSSRARSTRALFSPLLNESNRDRRSRLRARPVIREVFGQVSGLARGTELTMSIDEDLRLPTGTFAEWSAMFQNLIINAFNALLDSQTRRVDVSSAELDSGWAIRVQDTGYGIDLKRAPELFAPFERESRASPETSELGLGGTGLGLTIVAMLAGELQCDVRFVTPDPKFSTCAQISWEES